MRRVRFVLISVVCLMIVSALCTNQASADNKRTPSDDAFADGQAGQQALPHDNGQLGVGAVGSPVPGQLLNTFLKFDVSYTGTLTQATLWLYANTVTGSAHSIGVYSVSNDSWTEGTLTWINQPAMGSSSLATAAAATGWVSFDVTGYVSTEHSSDGVASFGVVIEPPYNFVVDVFEDRENTGNSGNLPYLQLVGVTAVNVASFTAEPEAGAIQVSWMAASDLNTQGFNLHRDQDPKGMDNGTAVKLNEEPLPASGDPILGGSYGYTDLDVETGLRYYYWLEVMGAGGGGEIHGPVSAVLAEYVLYLPFMARQSGPY
jgi:hypothetical protein